MARIELVLNRDGVRFVELVDDLGLERLETRYAFSDEEEYRELLVRDLSEGMRVYWTETLQRAHLAAVTAILRSRRWLSGVVHAAAENNFLIFSASLRGLMESAADASTAFLGTPLTLAHLQFFDCRVPRRSGHGRTCFFGNGKRAHSLFPRAASQEIGAGQCADLPPSAPSARIPEHFQGPECRQREAMLRRFMRPDPSGCFFRMDVAGVRRPDRLPLQTINAPGRGAHCRIPATICHDTA